MSRCLWSVRTDITFWYIDKIYTTAVKPRISSKLIFASSMWYFDRAYYGLYMTFSYLLAIISNFSSLRVSTSCECVGGSMYGFITDGPWEVHDESSLYSLLLMWSSTLYTSGVSTHQHQPKLLFNFEWLSRLKVLTFTPIRLTGTSQGCYSILRK